MIVKCSLYSSPKFHNLKNKGQINFFCAMAQEIFSLPKGFINIYELEEAPPAEHPFSLISILYCDHQAITTPPILCEKHSN